LKYAIIGGTGNYCAGKPQKTEFVETKYGNVEIDVIDYNGIEIAFLSRHGKNHGVPPHKINYRANMAALKKIGVDYVFTTCAVGSCNREFTVGSLVLIKDFLDFTKNRESTFFDGETGVNHVDMSDPYCKNLRKIFLGKIKEKKLDYKGEAVYVCTEGPRFETAAEIRYYASVGGDVVGMTNVPEVVLAKELGMCYSAVGIITNWCTGFSGDDITLHEITNSVDKNKSSLTDIFMEIFSMELNKENCNCKSALINL